MGRETVWIILSIVVCVVIGVSIGAMIEGFILGDILRMGFVACGVSLGVSWALWLTTLERFEWW